MPLQILRDNEGARIAGTIFWLEDLERLGLTYGDLLGYLEDSCVCWVCSPIHNRDKYTPADVKGWKKRHEELIDADTGDIASEFESMVPKVGDSKKPHIHLYGHVKGPKKPAQWSELLKDFADLNYRWVKVPDWGRIVRYCAHMDAPMKAQYDPLSVKGFGNADLSALTEIKKENKFLVLMEVNEYIEKNRIRNFYRLNRWALETGDIQIMACVSGRASYFSAIFAAKAAEKAEKEAKEKATSQKTGA